MSISIQDLCALFTVFSFISPFITRGWGVRTNGPMDVGPRMSGAPGRLAFVHRKHVHGFARAGARVARLPRIIAGTGTGCTKSEQGSTTRLPGCTLEY